MFSFCYFVISDLPRRPVSSLRDSDHFEAYPGLTPWANIFRPSGAGLASSLLECSNPHIFFASLLLSRTLRDLCALGGQKLLTAKSAKEEPQSSQRKSMLQS
jgi:hypothetical protein